jgi:hypothetical protein
LPVFAALALLLAAHGGTVAAQGGSAAQTSGFAPDAQLVGGVGFALGRGLDNPFLARARVGGLYAREPWILNAGVTLELGMLGKLGFGGELELNSGQGLFAEVGLARIDGGAWMSHLSLGYTVFGLEWQQRFDGAKPSTALLFEVRIPMGIWWLTRSQKHAEQEATRKAQAALAARPRRFPAAATNQPAPAPPTAAPMPPPVTPPTPAAQAQLEAALAEAKQQTERGDHARAAMALGRAYALQPDPLLLLQLSAAEQAQGEWLLAASELRRFLALPGAPDVDRERPAVQARLSELERRLPQLRLVLAGANGDESVAVDGVATPAAALGYDVPLDPGTHALAITRAGKTLAERSFSAAESEVVRIELDLAKPDSHDALKAQHQ